MRGGETQGEGVDIAASEEADIVAPEEAEQVISLGVEELVRVGEDIVAVVMVEELTIGGGVGEVTTVVESAASSWSSSGRVDTTLWSGSEVESGGEELDLQRLVDTSESSESSLSMETSLAAVSHFLSLFLIFSFILMPATT